MLMGFGIMEIGLRFGLRVRYLSCLIKLLMERFMHSYIQVLITGVVLILIFDLFHCTLIKEVMDCLLLDISPQN